MSNDYKVYRLETMPGTSREPNYTPSTITFKARTQREADNKAHKFIRESEITGRYYRAVEVK